MNASAAPSQARGVFGFVASAGGGGGAFTQASNGDGMLVTVASPHLLTSPQRQQGRSVSPLLALRASEETLFLGAGEINLEHLARLAGDLLGFRALAGEFHRHRVLVLA